MAKGLSRAIRRIWRLLPAVADLYRSAEVKEASEVLDDAEKQSPRKRTRPWFSSCAMMADRAKTHDEAEAISARCWRWIRTMR